MIGSDKVGLEGGVVEGSRLTMVGSCGMDV